MIRSKILRFLIENKEKSHSINEIAKNINSDYKLIYINMQKLIEEKLVKINKLGNRSECSFNFAFNNLVLKVEEERRNELLKNQNMQIIHEKLKQLSSPFFMLLVFGSYATKKQKKLSDIDLAFISDNSELTKKINHIISLLPLEIHLLDFKTKEFIDMLSTTKDNVGKEIVKNNIILFGIENYYTLLHIAYRK